jgi:heat shock protein 5
MRNTVEDTNKLADKLEQSEKDEINEALTNAEDWLSSNEDAEREDYDDQRRELTQICDPIIARIYNEQGG